MKLNLQAFNKPTSRLFTSAFRIGSETASRSENFLVPPRGIRDDDAVRVLFSSRGVFKVDGEGETPAIEKAKPKRDPGKQSYLGRALNELSSITSGIQTLQENIENDLYTSDLQKEAVNEEIESLQNEYQRIVESDNFQRAVNLILEVRTELKKLSDEELYKQLDGDTPLVSENLNELAENKDASLINRLVVDLEKLLEVPDSSNSDTLERLKDSIERASAVERGGNKVEERKESAFENLLSDLNQTVQRLKFIREGKEKQLFTSSQLDVIEEEEKELEKRYKDIVQSSSFKEISNALVNIGKLRSGKPGLNSAINYAEEQNQLLGDSFSSLLEKFRFGEVDELSKTLKKISEAGEKLSELSSDDLKKLGKLLDRAEDIVSGKTLEYEEDPAIKKRQIDLNQTVFEKYKQKFTTRLLDEVEDFLEFAEKDANGLYTLTKTRLGGPKKSFLDIIA